MGEIQGYNISRDDISGRVCVAKCDYSNDCGSILAQQQGTTSANYKRTNLVYTGSGSLDNTIAVVGQDMSATPYHNSNLNYGGIYLDEDWMDKLCKAVKATDYHIEEIKGVNESIDDEEITVPPMRGFIEI